MNEFSLNIELGNDSMEEGEDVAQALEQVTRRVRQGYLSGSVVDANDNNVGEWQFS